MGFFNSKATCTNCQNEIGLNRFKIVDGWLCPTCFKLCSPFITMQPTKRTITEVREDIVRNDPNNKVNFVDNSTNPNGHFIINKEKPKKKTGCLIPILILIGIILISVIIISFLFPTNENNSSSNQSTNKQLAVLETITNATEQQKLKISNVLVECEITDIISVTYDEMLKGNYAISDPNSTEDGYRISTLNINNIILYIQNGEVLAIRYADKDLYKDGKVIIKLTELQ